MDNSMPLEQKKAQFKLSARFYQIQIYKASDGTKL